MNDDSLELLFKRHIHSASGPGVFKKCMFLKKKLFCNYKWKLSDTPNLKQYTSDFREPEMEKLVKTLLVIFLIPLDLIFAQQIKIVYPIKGDKVDVSRDQLVWYGTLTDIAELSTDGGRTWAPVNFSGGFGSGNLFTRGWSAPGKVSDSCKIRIYSKLDSSNRDETNGLFSSYETSYDSMCVNEIKMLVGSNGTSAHDPFRDAPGFFWPGGKSASLMALYMDGLCWVGNVDGTLKANGNNYGGTGLIPGSILNDGSAAKPSDPRFKLWKLKKGWEQLPNSKEKTEYEYNYDNWPVELGAPWVDVNNDGTFSRGTDLPEYLGDEQFFYVANDMDSAKTKLVFGSMPIGLEFQVSVFAFSDAKLKDVVFKRIKLINKSKKTISDMYLSYFADADLGDWMNDFTGCDSALGLAYIYNSTNDDYYYGTAPPAIGHLWLETPAVPDSSRGGHKSRQLSLTSYTPNFEDSQPLPEAAGNAAQVSLMARGLLPSGKMYTDPHTGRNTYFPLSGDPASNTGWFEGSGWPGGPRSYDRRYWINSGPFNMAAGDTQQVTVAVLMARGTDNLRSVTELKNEASYVKDFYSKELLAAVGEHKPAIALDYRLGQNYPNPFNPATSIVYSIPEKSMVHLKVFDILGREVSTLVNETKDSGKYKVQFEASHLPSGVYIYTIEAGSFRDSKKLMLIK